MRGKDYGCPICPYFLFIHINFIYLHRNLKDALKRRQGAAVGDIETGTACFWGGLLLRGTVGFQINPTLYAGFDLDFWGCHTENLRLFIASMPVPLASICRFCRASFRFELTPKCYRLCAKLWGINKSWSFWSMHRSRSLSLTEVFTQKQSSRSLSSRAVFLSFSHRSWARSWITQIIISDTALHKNDWQRISDVTNKVNPTNCLDEDETIQPSRWNFQRKEMPHWACKNQRNQQSLVAFITLFFILDLIWSLRFMNFELFWQFHLRLIFCSRNRWTPAPRAI